MKKLLTLTLLAVCAFGAWQVFAQTPPPAEPRTPGTRDAGTGADQSFLDQALASGLKEIDAAVLARQRAEDEDVLELATMLENDHRALNGQLESAGARAPADDGRDAASMLASDPQMKPLTTAEGADFDAAYLAMTVRMHEQSIARFESVANGNGHSAEVKALAAQALPKLREHHRKASSLRQAMAEE